MTQELGPLARRLALPYYDDALPAHDAFHAERVRDVAIRLADESDRTVDRGVLAAAAWLHDIGRPLERTGEIADHDEWAAREAADRLAAEGVSTDRVDAVEHCIRAHSIRSSSPEPETPEAKFLFDADKLDAAGARGIVRLACIVGERSGRSGESYAVIDDESAAGVDAPDAPDVGLLREWTRERLDALHTTPGRRLGESRWQFVAEFFAQFDAEAGVDGAR
ncbi:HD domain-containing protein [Halorussus rarus]|uniref:HD domain-containing protein n=1 Tax=Halorussus TaxID=1070314 RepID=UPI000E20DC3B|nr:HD domain-containing protein [Halorussus rarus]NHN61454.1 HD domain-containing protein [Halorussus sp. JP-T4]